MSAATAKSTAAAPRFRVVEAAAFERPVRLRLPFRFGVVTLRETPQLFLRVTVETPDGRRASGHTAELMVPKWFDKRPELSDADNVDQLRRSVRAAITGALDMGEPASLADVVAAVEAGQAARLPEENGLVAGFGAAELQKAAIDAVCRLADVSVHRAFAENLIGLEARHLPADARGVVPEDELAMLRPATSLALRHTVGLVDAITEADVVEPVGDGLPESLEGAIRAQGLTHFKIKVGGRAEEDLDRLRRIAAVLDRLPAYRATLDGNEQYDGPDGFADLLDRIDAEPALDRLRRAILYVEQPIRRDRALSVPLGALAGRLPFLIDESDDRQDAFLAARDLGYRGVSSKACKGVLRAVVNRLRTAAWPTGGWFLSAEDLTTQAGLAVQQDLAVAAMLGLGHVERNGHHYVDGMAGADAAEQAAFALAHPDLYRLEDGRLRLSVRDGRLSIASLSTAGFASGAIPDFGAMRRLD